MPGKQSKESRSDYNKVRKSKLQSKILLDRQGNYMMVSVSPSRRQSNPKCARTK